MASKKILIIYARNKNEVFDRKSVLGTTIKCISELISGDSIDVYLNGVLLSDIPLKEETAQTSVSGRLNWIKKMIPRRIKRLIRDQKQWQRMDSFKEELLASSVKYDAILEFYTLGSSCGYALSQQQNIPLTILYDGPIREEYRFFNQNKLPFQWDKLQALEIKTLTRAHRIIAYSPAVTSYLVELTNGKVSPEKISYHQNIDFSRFNNYPDKVNKPLGVINIGFIGSFLKWHEVDKLVEVFEQLMEKGINAELYLVGTGPEYKSVLQQVKTSKWQSKIHLTGFLDGEKLLAIKRKLHIGVMPGSNWYGAPNKLFEYGAMKLACIAPNTPTIEFIFQDDEIGLFEWKNKDAMRSALEKLCLDPNLIETKANLLYHKIERDYSPEIAQAFYRDTILP